MMELKTHMHVCDIIEMLSVIIVNNLNAMPNMNKLVAIGIAH
jgi:hypothetical protein